MSANPKDLTPLTTFLSDNAPPAHPAVVSAIMVENKGYAIPYGEDRKTHDTISLLKQRIGAPAEAYVSFVHSGTSANTITLRALTNSEDAIMCTECAHIRMMERGAIEHNTGCSLLPLPSPDGKLRARQIESYFDKQSSIHMAKPRVVSISQPTEYGNVYTPEELGDIAEITHRLGMLLHMDGARLANAAAFLNVPYAAITTDIGVDALAFGGTKNGLMHAEAIVIYRKEAAGRAWSIQKQQGQGVSKMRYLAAEFYAYLVTGLSEQNAQDANNMAHVLATALRRIPDVKVAESIETNMVLVTVPKALVDRLARCYTLYPWGDKPSTFRVMTSYATTMNDVENFSRALTDWFAGSD